MDLILYMLSRAPHWGNSSTSSSFDMPSPARKRLQKAPPAHYFSKSIFACENIFSVVQAQSCLTIYPADDELTPQDDVQSEKSQPHIAFLLQDPPSYSDSKDQWSTDSESAEKELSTLRRTRAKTPVFAVGQLERASMIRQSTPHDEDVFDQAQSFAKVYQAVLPPRTETPSIDDQHRQSLKKTPKTLRKMKCQLSLRDLNKDQASEFAHPTSPSSRPTSDSDLETLVGSESPCSPTFAKKDRLPIIPAGNPHDRNSLALSDFDNDIGLKMCVDLLTNELASVLFRHHPAENQDRASGLQILLMIESYETVQQHVRKQLYDAHVTHQRMEHLESVEGILEHWLQVLYSVYDRSVGRKSNESLRIRHDEWPLQRLEEENAPPYA